MPSVASQVTAAIAQRHRDAKVPAAANSNDRAASSPFTEMLDSTVETRDSAPPKASKPDKSAAAPAKKSTRADDAAANRDREPSQQVEPGYKDAGPAKPAAKTETKAEAAVVKAEAAVAVEAEPETETVAEAAPAEPDTPATDLEALLEAVAVVTTLETEGEQVEDKEKPADTDAEAAPPADAKTVVKADAAADAVALPATDIVADVAVPAGDAKVKSAAKSIPVDTTAVGAGEADKPKLDPAAVTDKTLAEPKPSKADAVHAEPVKQDTEGATAAPADRAQAHAELKAATAHAHHDANGRRADATEAKPATADVSADTAPSAKPADLPPPTQPLTQPGLSATGPVHAVTPQKDVAAPPAAVPIEGVAVEIASKALEGKNRFEIRLDPPELGRIHVRLDVDRNGEITSRVMADRQDTLDLLRREAPQLERALSDAGLRTAGNGLQFSLRDHGQGRHEQQQFTNATQLIINDESLAAETMPRGYYRPAGLAGGLDIRV